MDNLTGDKGTGGNPWKVPKLEKIMAQLTELAERQKAAAPGPELAQAPAAKDETIGNDGPVGAAVKARIEADEEIIRPVLALLGVDYPALIAMDGQSPYSQAVAARPELLKQVLESPRPVLAALQVAVGYKPYAEFGRKYGRTPEEVKARISREALEEAGVAAGQAPAAAPPLGAVFAGVTGARAIAPRRGGGLDKVFGR